MLIDKLRRSVQFIFNKDEVGGYLSPSRFSIAVEQAQLELLYDIKSAKEGDLKGNFLYTSEGNDANLIAIDELGNFRKDGTLYQLNNRFPKPDDYIGFNTMRHEFYNETVRNIELVGDDEFNSRRNSELRGPTLKRPIAKVDELGFEVLPSNIPAVKITYYAMPLIPYWNYTIQGGEPVFAETGGSGQNPNPGVAAGDSTDLVFSDAMLSELTYRVCAKLGINLREGEAFQMVKTEESQ